MFNINSRLKLVRNHFHISQELLGKKLGISKSAISLIEKGTNGLSTQNVLSICREFNINENWLLTGEGEMIEDKPLQIKSAGAMAQLIKKDNKFAMNLVSALNEMSDDEIDFIQTFLKKLFDYK